MENNSQVVDVSSHQKLGTRTPLPGRVAWLQIARADFKYFKKGRGRRGPERCQPLSLNMCIFLFLIRSWHSAVLSSSSSVCPMPSAFLIPHLYME